MEENNMQQQETVRQYVESIGKWYKFFAIVSIIGIAFMTLSAIASFIGGNALAEVLNSNSNPPMPLTVMGIVYLICAAIYLPIVLYLLRASKEAKTAVLMNDNNALANFLLYSKKYWKYNGIVTIIVLCITLLVIIFSVIAAVTAAALLQ